MNPQTYNHLKTQKNICSKSMKNTYSEEHQEKKPM